MAVSEYQFLITEGFSSNDCSTGKTYSDIGVPVDVCHPENAEYRKVEIMGAEAIHMYYNDSDCSGNVLRNETFSMNCTQNLGHWSFRGTLSTFEVWGVPVCLITNGSSKKQEAVSFLSFRKATEERQ